jgi:hypothetical protein
LTERRLVQAALPEAGSLEQGPGKIGVAHLHPIEDGAAGIRSAKAHPAQVRAAEIGSLQLRAR